MFALYDPKTKQVETFTEANGLMQVSGLASPVGLGEARDLWRMALAAGSVRVDEKPYVDSHSSHFGTSYEVVGTPDAINGFRERLYANFHPCGYGTHIPAGDEIAPGVCISRGSRSNSCD